MLNPLLAQTFTNVLETGLQDSQKVAESWDNNWQLVFSGGSVGGTTLFAALNELGLLFAIGALIVSGLGFYRAFSQQRPVDYALFFWAVIGVALFARDGALMAKCILGLREIINQISDQIITGTLAGVKIDEVLRQIQGDTSARELLENAYEPCLSMSGQEQIACFESASGYADTLKNIFSSTIGASGWFDDIARRFRDAGNALQAGASFSMVGMFTPFWQPIVYSVLYWMMQAYQHLLEAVLILTGLMAPLAVGGAMFVFGVNSLVAWMTGFFAVGMAKISFNIIVGLAAVTFTNSGVNDPGWFPLFVGLFAPFFSFAISSGSGFAVWSAFTSIAATGARAGAGLVGGPVGYGAAAVATSKKS